MTTPVPPALEARFALINDHGENVSSLQHAFGDYAAEQLFQVGMQIARSAPPGQYDVGVAIRAAETLAIAAMLFKQSVTLSANNKASAAEHFPDPTPEPTPAQIEEFICVEQERIRNRNQSEFEKMKNDP